MYFRISAVAAIALATVFSLPTTAAEPSGVGTQEAAKAKLVKVKLGGIKQMHVLDDIYLAGQPNPQDIKLLKQQGIKTVVTLRKPNEVRWDEAALVRQQGLTFVEIPFQSPDELKPAVFDQLRKELLDKKRGPLLLHCGSANRVGAVWYAHRVLDQNIEPDVALKEATTVGLRSPKLLEKAKAYVERVQSQPANPGSATR